MGALPGAEGSGSESSNGVASDEYFTPDSPETESSESDVLETEHSGVEAKSRTLNYSSHLNFLPAEFRLEVMEKLCNLTPVTEVLNVIEDAYFCAKVRTRMRTIFCEPKIIAFSTFLLLNRSFVQNLFAVCGPLWRKLVNCMRKAWLQLVGLGYGLYIALIDVLLKP